jgi:HPt (histidine-containing phosphotransfer) domain-containing protein
MLNTQASADVTDDMCEIAASNGQFFDSAIALADVEPEITPEETISPAEPDPLVELPVETPETPVLDPKAIQTILEIAGEGEDALQFFNEVIGVYVDDSCRAIANMRAAFEQKDAAKLLQAAHTLKPNSDYVGAIVLGQYCRQIEVIALMGELDGVEAHLQQVEAEHAKVIHALQVEREQRSAQLAQDRPTTNR